MRDQAVLDETSPHVVDRRQEGPVDRGLHDRAIAGLGVGGEPPVEPLHHVAQDLDPGRLERPVEARLHPLAECLAQARVLQLDRVAEIVASERPLEHLANRLRQRIVHLGHPGRQHVRGMGVPLLADARVQHRGVEVVEVDGRIAHRRLSLSETTADVRLRERQRAAEVRLLEHSGQISPQLADHPADVVGVCVQPLHFVAACWVEVVVRSASAAVEAQPLVSAVAFEHAQGGTAVTGEVAVLHAQTQGAELVRPHGWGV